jgi:hypothetical protein
MCSPCCTSEEYDQDDRGLRACRQCHHEMVGRDHRREALARTTSDCKRLSGTVAGPGGVTELLGTKPSTLDVSHFATWYQPRNASLRIPTSKARWSNLSERIDLPRRSAILSYFTKRETRWRPSHLNPLSTLKSPYRSLLELRDRCRR